MKGLTELSYLMFFIVVIIFFVGLGYLGLPEEYKIIESSDVAFVGAGLVGVTGACVLTTGIPCAAAITTWSLIGVNNYLLVSVEWLKILVMTPLTLGFIYVIMKLARGN